MTIIQQESGYTNVTHETDNTAVQMALYNLEDGLSYLNYALNGSDMGLCDPQADLDTAIGFLAQALEILNEVNLNE